MNPKKKELSHTPPNYNSMTAHISNRLRRLYSPTHKVEDFPTFVSKAAQEAYWKSLDTACDRQAVDILRRCLSSRTSTPPSTETIPTLSVRSLVQGTSRPVNSTNSRSPSAPDRQEVNLPLRHRRDEMESGGLRC